MLKRLTFVSFLLVVISVVAEAQDLEVDKYTISVRVDPNAGTLDTRAGLDITNLSATPKSRLYFRLTKLAKVSGASVNGAAARVETADDRRVTALNQIIIIPPASLGAGAKARVEFTYLIEAMESTPTAAVTPGEVLMTPEAVWFPMPSTMFTMYGATTAPFSLTITGASGTSNLKAFSAGEAKTTESGVTFEQPLNSLPFLVAGNLDRTVSVDHGGVKIEIIIQSGLVAGAADPEAAAGVAAPPIVAKLSEEAGKVIAFLTKSLGPPPTGASLRIISSTRTGNLALPGALVLSEQALRRDVINSSTLEWLADSLARLWIEGRVKVRGQDARQAQGDRPAQKARSTALIRDSLPRYLATLYLEDRFGPNAALEAFQNMRDAYTPVASSGRDAELGIQTILSATYGAAAFSKGPLVLRLIAETMGREKFITGIKAILVGPNKIVTTDDLRTELVKAGGSSVEKLFQQWVESIVEPDLVIGIPVATDNPNVQRINLRNLGNGDITTRVLAVTASGKQLSGTVTVPSEDLASVEIQTGEKITTAEVDPEKLIIQTNYDNDMKPPRTSAQTLLNESIVAFNRRDFVESEKKLRDAVAAQPQSSLSRAWLARALAAQNKTDEAVNAANAAIANEPPGGAALSWAHFTLGQIALSRGNSADGIRHLRRALVEAEDAPAQFAIREALVKAERSKSAPDESVRAYINQLDQAIKQPSSDTLYTMVVKNNLKRFVQGITVTPPTAWATEILRVEKIDANRVALDVSIRATAGGREQSGTAVYILHRVGSSWMLEDVQLFNVK